MLVATSLTSAQFEFLFGCRVLVACQLVGGEAVQWRVDGFFEEPLPCCYVAGDFWQGRRLLVTVIGCDFIVGVGE